MARPIGVIIFSFFTIILALVALVTGALTYTLVETLVVYGPGNMPGGVVLTVALFSFYLVLIYMAMGGTSALGLITFIQQFSLLVLIIGLLGFVCVAGLLMMKRWGLWLTIVVNIVVLVVNAVIGAIFFGVSSYYIPFAIFAIPAFIVVIYEALFTVYLYAKRDEFM